MVAAGVVKAVRIKGDIPRRSDEPEALWAEVYDPLADDTLSA